MPELVFTDPSERDDLGAFVARAVRLDQQVVVRLRNRPTGGHVDAWVATPFDTLATRTVAGRVDPGDVTVSGSDLLTGLAVLRGDTVDAGPAKDLMWRSALPPLSGWQRVDLLPGAVVTELADQGVALARENTGPHGTPPASLLDQTVLTVSGSGLDVKVPLRCLFALSGMGFLGGDDVRVTATDSWLRIDARFGAVVRRRHSMLPLLV
ncbi:hypothetical protein KCV87_14900 [Actinosynnema pretiosum subsp. pretiosum]|uniref:Uncharacterized protein n=2 Tax=Actinosynnema TaxID=40566 RepID=C6WQ32_ACTMD|nr:hypothetical protein [Actinosynnema mirum]ACU35088.1 hypothetical protein Amir_1133 [Actinosynnema mirum DSM 43827]AXX28444.1 hypothetical protein APASM_1079 [Actinosynnema pretiosum subsp. pretiosum]QUF07207.1 hypothetical protein KCV87_14900 [Actinosynnema pretiosum subsp. pretiosum]